jgi:hypothetical protein
MFRGLSAMVQILPFPGQQRGRKIAIVGSSEQKAQLYLRHPDESPEVVGVLPYLIHPPSKLSSTAAWLSFRDKTLLPMIQHRPDDPNLAKFLKQVGAVLAWRATIPPEARFWKADTRRSNEP